MKIGIDCRKILNPEAGEQAGIAHYTYYLVKHLLEIDRKNQYVLFFDRRILSTKEFEAPNVMVRFLPFYQYKRYLPFTYSHLLISAFLEKERLDLFHMPFPALPLRYRGTSVTTVHDLAIYHHPEWFPTSFGKQVFSTKILVPSSIKSAKKVIAVSKFTKEDILKLFTVESNKVNVIYEGVVEEPTILESQWKEIKKKLDLPETYVLYLGTIEPRKNIGGIIEAFLKVKKENPSVVDQLVIAGGKGWRNASIFKAINRAKDVVSYLGPVSHKEKIALISHAKVFVWPSLYEGFGLPVLEAMSQGVPVITSSVTSIPEVAGDAAVLIDPKSTFEITEALQNVLTDEKLWHELSVKGKEQAKKFSWKKTAEETLEAYREAAAA